MAEATQYNDGLEPEVRYIYYRTYLADGLIPSKSAFNPGDPFTGRIPARSVPPPHSVATLKRCLAHAENFVDPSGILTKLYGSPSEREEIRDDGELPILSSLPILPSGSRMRGRIERPVSDGSNPATPYAFVFENELSIEEMGKREIMGRGAQRVQEFLYYHLYTRTGEAVSILSFNPDQPAIGRILKADVAPPWSAPSIKRSVAKAEKKPIYLFADIYQDISARNSLRDHHCLPAGLGATVENPLVLVQPERRAGLYNRPLKILSGETAPLEILKKIKTGQISVWLAVPRGEIVHTDGVAEEHHIPSKLRGDHSVSVYTAVYNHQQGLIMKNADTKFLDE